MQVLKKRNREDSVKDSEDTKRIEKRHRDASSKHASSAKDSCRSADNVASEQKIRGTCSTGTDSGLAKNELIDSSVSHNLPGMQLKLLSSSLFCTKCKFFKRAMYSMHRID